MARLTFCRRLVIAYASGAVALGGLFSSGCAASDGQVAGPGVGGTAGSSVADGSGGSLNTGGSSAGGSGIGGASAGGSANGGATSTGGSANTGGSSGGLAFDIPLTSLTAHNTSAAPAYNRTNFGANFGTSTWVSQSGATMPVDPTRADLSLNPVTPGHVSHVDVHSLIPSRPDLRWFAHVVPWFRASGGPHINIGVNNDSMVYVKSMVTDMKSRGFDGLVVDWYGQGSYEDQVTLLIQQYLQSVPNNKFTFIIMMDKGIKNLSQSVLETQIQYCKSQYFKDPNYELEGGKPILMFFGVNSALGNSTMAAVKSATGGNMVWVAQGAGSLSNSWVDECFDWTHDYLNGVDTSDPYNLSATAAFYSAVAKSSKKAFGSMVAGFNGMLTNSVGWSKGKYLPRGSGACVIERAKKINAVIPPNVTRMQWATWNDWEEGSSIEGGVENDVTVKVQHQGSVLTWGVSGGTGDESTIDHYQVYVSTDRVNAADLGSVPVGTHSFDVTTASGLQSGTTYSFYVDAVGRPNIRDHLSDAVSFAP